MPIAHNTTPSDIRVVQRIALKARRLGKDPYDDPAVKWLLCKVQESPHVQLEMTVKAMLDYVCPYCMSGLLLRESEITYLNPEQILRTKNIHRWECPDCDDVYVGVHAKEPLIPLGCAADHNLREARIAAHTAFDILWVDPGPLRTGRRTRREISNRAREYHGLAKSLGLPALASHIGLFDSKLCGLTVEYAVQQAKDRGIAFKHVDNILKMWSTASVNK